MMYELENTGAKCVHCNETIFYNNLTQEFVHNCHKKSTDSKTEIPCIHCGKEVTFNNVKKRLEICECVEV